MEPLSPMLRESYFHGDIRSMITDNWCTADEIAKENGHKNKIDIHNNAICSDSIFTCYFHKLKII